MTIAASLSALACGASNATAQPSQTVPPQMAATLVDLALACQKTGVACLEHCEKMLAAGDATMNECLASARDMLAVVEMLAKLAKSGSPHLASAVRLAMETCGACEAACRKHGDQHAVCRDCADACAKTVALCRQILA